MPDVSNTGVLRLAFGNSFGSGNTLTALVFGSTRTIAFSPPSVTQAAPSGPTMTPCGAEPLPSGTRCTSPLVGSSRPSSPAACAVYQTVPSGAGATSWGADPAGTGNSFSAAMGDGCGRAEAV